jgi:uncharacterized membrane protein YfcA
VNTTLLIILASTFGAISIYFTWRYYLRRRDPSLVCALMPLGWVAAFALQIERLPHDVTPLLFGLGMCVAAWSIYIIVRHELSREYPFR